FDFVCIENLEMDIGECFELALKFSRNDVAHPQALTTNLILIGRPDSLQRRTNFVFTFSFFVSHVEQSVCRQNQRRFLRDKKVLLYVQIELTKFLNFIFENDRIEHDAVANYISRCFTKDS